MIYYWFCNKLKKDLHNGNDKNKAKDIIFMYVEIATNKQYDRINFKPFFFIIDLLKIFKAINLFLLLTIFTKIILL